MDVIKSNGNRVTMIPPSPSAGIARQGCNYVSSAQRELRDEDLPSATCSRRDLDCVDVFRNIVRSHPVEPGQLGKAEDGYHEGTAGLD